MRCSSRIVLGAGDGDDGLHVEALAHLALGHQPHQALFLGFGGVGHGHLQEEAVQLGLGQGIGALLLDGVLGGQHHEGAGHREGLALDGHLLLLHDLQQGGLGLGGGAVDLVRQQQVGEDRPLADAEALGLGVVDGVAHDIRGHQVGRELDAGVGALEGLGQGAHQQGLAQARDALQQDVPAREEAGQDLVHHGLLAHQGLADLRAEAAGERPRPRPAVRVREGEGRRCQGS